MSKITLDFSNVRDGSTFSPRRLPEGAYLATIAKVESEESKAGNPMLVYTIIPVEHPTAIYPYYILLDEKQLWKFRALLLAAGKEVPKRKVTVDPESIVGKQVMIDLEDAEWEGREKSNIAGVFKPEQQPEPASDGEIEFDVDEI
jgi:hypothetical protein|nr:MAG TPA: Protein of unknown function (DUF669) [Caudoviricetes sp.]